MILRAENYFSPEAQMHYMGVSQIKSFQKCEAMTLAELKGEFVREKTVSMLVGSYVDAHFENTLDIFKAKNPDIFTRNGELKSNYRQAEYIIERITRDEFFMKYMSGESQVIKTGEINGIPFKIKIDSYHPQKAIVDLKVMKDFEPIWVPEQGKVSFIEAWGYDLQGAIYQMVEGNKLPFYIAGATKEKEPDIAVIQIPQQYLDVAYEVICDDLQRYQGIKKGEIEPTRCEHCDYCKQTKILKNVTSMEEFENELR